MKRVFLFFSFLAVLVSCEKERPGVKQSDAFKALMGENKSVWQHVETAEDYRNLEIFKALYEKNLAREVSKESTLKIPKVIHFIWVGPNPFPKESVDNVRSWIEHHPGWTYKFWTDRKRPLPQKGMEFHLVSDFEFSALKECFEDSDNYAEKSDLLRYEILLKEGGLYVDHDVECFNSFDSFHHAYDFYCGLETPHTPILSSSISVCNNVIGARKGHPVFQEAIQKITQCWEEIGTAYPGKDKDSIVYRVAQRTFATFDDAVREHTGKKGNRDIVFPAAYFNRIEQDPALYAHHYYASTWFEDETKFERNVRRRLISISKKNNQILLFNGAILTANLALCVGLVVMYRSKKRKGEK